MMVHTGFVQAFLALGNIDVCVEDYRDHLDRELQQADVVLITGYHDPSRDVPRIKQKTGARYVASFAEEPFPGVDRAFTCREFKLPCCKSLLPNVAKQPKSIIIDHTWYVRDRTELIEGWLTGWEGPLYRQTRPGTENHPVPPYVTPLPYLPYLEYLAVTARMERIILTHLEDYPFGAVDMAARGIQVLAMPGSIVCTYIIEDMGIPLFDNKEELLAILNQPVGDEWNHKIDLCTDYLDIARAMNGQFMEWLQ